MRFSPVVAAIVLAAVQSHCQAYDHATIVGDLYNYQFCDSCDHSLYRHTGDYNYEYFNVGDAEAGVVSFDVPAELKPFRQIQLQLYLNTSTFYQSFPVPTFDVSMNGFDGTAGNVGPSGLTNSIPITSPYSVSRFDDHRSVDVTDFVRLAMHANISFTITGNSTVWIMAYPQLLVFPVPEPASFLLMIAAAFCSIGWLRRRQSDLSVLTE